MATLEMLWHRNVAWSHVVHDAYKAPVGGVHPRAGWPVHAVSVGIEADLHVPIARVHFCHGHARRLSDECRAAAVQRHHRLLRATGALRRTVGHEDALGLGAASGLESSHHRRLALVQHVRAECRATGAVRLIKQDCIGAKHIRGVAVGFVASRMRQTRSGNARPSAHRLVVAPRFAQPITSRNRDVAGCTACIGPFHHAQGKYEQSQHGCHPFSRKDAQEACLRTKTPKQVVLSP